MFSTTKKRQAVGLGLRKDWRVRVAKYRWNLLFTSAYTGDEWRYRRLPNTEGLLGLLGEKPHLLVRRTGSVNLLHGNCDITNEYR